MTRASGSLLRLVTATALVAAALAACGSGDGESPSAASPGTQPSTSASATPAPSPTAPSASLTPKRPPLSGRPIVAGVPPKWLGKRSLPLGGNGFGEVRPTPPELVVRRFTLPDTLRTLPGDGFDAQVRTPAPASVIARSTWKKGCPVAATDLSWVRLAFWGFDNRRHTGELLVNRSVADAMVSVFRQLYTARFPIEEMRITRLAELDAPPTGDGNNTGAFNCRVTKGGSSYSEHAHGLAIDVNPFQNPYVKGDLVLPELASSYLDRAYVRPGMIAADGPVVRAFDAIGWTWGGGRRSLKDPQHFSQNRR